MPQRADHARLDVERQDGGEEADLARRAALRGGEAAELLAQASRDDARSLGLGGRADKVDLRRQFVADAVLVIGIDQLNGVRLIAVILVGEGGDELVEGCPKRCQGEGALDDVAFLERFGGAAVEADERPEPAAGECVAAEAVGQDLGDPVAQRLLLAQNAGEDELLLGAGADDRRDLLVTDGRGRHAGRDIEHGLLLRDSGLGQAQAI